MKRIILLAYICLSLLSTYGQVEPANNDQKLKDSSVRQSNDYNAAQAHSITATRYLFFVILFLLIIGAFIWYFNKKRKK